MSAPPPDGCSSASIHFLLSGGSSSGPAGLEALAREDQDFDSL